MRPYRPEWQEEDSGKERKRKREKGVPSSLVDRRAAPTRKPQGARRMAGHQRPVAPGHFPVALSMNAAMLAFSFPRSGSWTYIM